MNRIRLVQFFFCKKHFHFRINIIMNHFITFKCKNTSGLNFILIKKRMFILEKNLYMNIEENEKYTYI